MTTGTYRYQDRWKWFLPASWSSLNPSGPQGKTKNLFYRTRNCIEKILKISLLSLLIPFLGPIRGGDFFYHLPYHSSPTCLDLQLFSASSAIGVCIIVYLWARHLFCSSVFICLFVFVVVLYYVCFVVWLLLLFLFVFFVVFYMYVFMLLLMCFVVFCFFCMFCCLLLFFCVLSISGPGIFDALCCPVSNLANNSQTKSRQ